MFRLWQPRRPAYAKAGKPDPERPSKPVLAVQIINLLADALEGRQIDVVGDCGYASGAFKKLNERVTITARLRANAVLYAPAPPRTGKPGRPRKWGGRLGSLTQITKDPATRFSVQPLKRYGQDGAGKLADIHCLWEPLGATIPARLILVKDPDRASGYQLSLISTDPHSTPGQIIERYANRWPIEVAFEEAKHIVGVGDARNRTRKAVQRTVPFQFLVMDLTIIWYALHGHRPDTVAQRRRQAPWYQTKRCPSCQDMLAVLRRTIIAEQYRPEPGRTPTSQEIEQVQRAWAAASL